MVDVWNPNENKITKYQVELRGTVFHTVSTLPDTLKLAQRLGMKHKTRFEIKKVQVADER